ncbi:MAG: PAS domain S-box protein [Anaerolinea sp.]|nr:PAS domain S-box protein [Anaerolinea sp.]
MFETPRENPLNVLIAAPAENRRQQIVETLAANRLVNELTVVGAALDMKASPSGAWDVIIVLAADVNDVLTRLPDQSPAPSIIILYEKGEEERACSIRDQRVIDILPVSGIHRLPLILERERTLRQTQTITAQLRQAESRFKAIVEGLGDPIIVVDRYGIIRYSNEAIQRVLGHEVGVMLGQALERFSSERERDQIRNFLSELHGSEQIIVTLTHQFRRSNATWATVETTGHSMVDPQGKPFVVLHLRDVTDQRQDKDALRINEARYRAIVEDQSDLICRYTPDFRLTFANRAYSQQHGKQPDEIIGANLLEMIVESDVERAKAHVLALSQDRPVAVSEHRTILPDGSIRWQQWNDRAIFDGAGKIVEYQGVGRDITDMKAAQNRLHFLHAIILATSRAENLEDALTKSMRLICETQDWEYGEIWMPDYDRQTLSVGNAHFIHPADKGRLHAFWEATHAVQFPAGGGIPGRAWSTQAPSWTVDVQQLSEFEFLRLVLAQQAGIHGVVAIPIVDKDKVLAVVVFMAQRRLNRDEPLLDLLRTALQQIAPIIRRQQLIERLAESEEKYRTLVDNFDGVITIADAEGRYLFANEKAWEPFNLPVHERAGKSVYDLFPPDVGDLFVERIRDVIRTGKRRVDTDGIQTGANFRWFRSIIAPLRDTDGAISRAQTIAFDVTDTHQAEAQLRQAQEIAHLGSMTWNLQTNETVWSDEFFRICGLEPGSVQAAVELGVSLIHPDDRERALAAVAESQRTGSPYSIEQRMVQPGGKIRWVIFQGQVTRDEKSQPVMLVGTFLDITERKQAEITLEQSSRRLHLLHQIDLLIPATDSIIPAATAALKGLLEIVPVMRTSMVKFNPDERTAFLLKLQSNVLDQPVEIALDELSAIDRHLFTTLTTKKHCLIQNLADHQPWSDLQAEGIRSLLGVALNYRDRLIGGLFLYAGEVNFFTETYIEIATEIADQLAIGINTIDQNNRIRRSNEELEDRVEQRTAELQRQQTRLRESEERYRTTITTMSEGITMMTRDGTIQLANAAAERILGLTREQIMGYIPVDPRWRVVHEDGSPVSDEESPIKIALLTGQPQANVVMGIHRPDDTVVWILVNAQPIRKPDEAAPYAAVSTFVDITQRKQAEEALQRAVEQERELGELKSRFVSIASHEFRTPLATISATTETLLAYRERLDEGQLDARLNKILAQVNHMKGIMEDVLQLARIQSARVEFRPEVGDLDQFCREIIQEFEARAEYSGRIVLERVPSPLRYNFDPRLMRQVIGNLISNALKYSPANQHVTLDLRVDSATITLKVQDTGIGIPESDVKHLFEPFHRASNVGTISGTGLGLSITKEAVDLHSGTIRIDTELNVGTTFVVTLPLERKTAHAQNPAH